MRRSVLATLQVSATALAMGLLATAGAQAQTVQDYRTALNQAPIVDAAAPLAADLCQPLMNFVYVSIPPWEQTTTWIGSLFGGNAADESLAAKRAACLSQRGTPVIDFTNAQNEPIVTPPELRDPNKENVVW